jgi:hypothetical protein
MKYGRFKSPVNGKYYTRQLFHEESIDLPIEKRVIEPFFTLYKDREGLINFGKAYIKSRDPSGYKVAQELLDGDYTLWTVLMGCRWFLAAKEVWDRELDAAFLSEALDQIRDLSLNGMPAQRLAAAKFLATRGYKKDNSANKGRPKREDIDRAAKDLAINERELEEDLKRIRGTN